MADLSMSELLTLLGLLWSALLLKDLSHSTSAAADMDDERSVKVVPAPKLESFAAGPMVTFLIWYASTVLLITENNLELFRELYN